MVSGVTRGLVYDLAALREDPATVAATAAIVVRAASTEALPVDLLALEQDAPVAVAEETLRIGWKRPPRPPVKLSVPVDWEGESSSDRGWGFHLHAWEPMSEPLIAYELTRQIRFLEWSLGLALDWVERYPRHDLSGFAWYDMAIGVRAFRLAYLVEAGSRAGLLDAETALPLVSSARLHLHVLSEEERFAEHSNHGMYQVAGQLALSRRMPELPESPAAAAQATERTARMVSRQFDQEGVHREHSPAYHLMVLRSLLRLRSAGLVTDPQVLATLDRAEEVLPWFVAPVGVSPPVGDSDRLPADALDDPHFRRPAARFALTQGRRGRAPSQPFRAFLDAGYVVARDRWAKKEDFERSSYLLQACGFHSQVHKHADDLSFVWYARGTDLLTDAGRFAYAGREEIDPALRELGFNYSDPRRIYVESTQAHNCLEIDGRSYPRRAAPYGSAIVSAERDAASGLVITEAKLAHPEGVNHRRYLFHLPGEWTLAVDYASGRPDTSHDYRQRFHFGPDLVELSEVGGCLRLPIPDSDAHLVATQIVPCDRPEPRRGQTVPQLLGFNARYANSLLPNWTVAWEQRERRSAVFAALFVIVPADAPFWSGGKLNATGRAGRLSWTVGRTRHQLRWNRVEGKEHEYRQDDLAAEEHSEGWSSLPMRSNPAGRPATNPVASPGPAADSGDLRERVGELEATLDQLRIEAATSRLALDHTLQRVSSLLQTAQAVEKHLAQLEAEADELGELVAERDSELVRARADYQTLLVAVQTAERALAELRQRLDASGAEPDTGTESGT